MGRGGTWLLVSSAVNFLHFGVLLICIGFWHSREDAYKGGLGPWHRKARAAGRELYESIVFSTYRLTVTDSVEGYAFEEWVK